MPPLPCLVLIDILGVKSRWVENARTGATTAFETLADLIDSALSDAPASVLRAELESDTAVVVCDSTNAALRFATAVYLEAFMHRSRGTGANARTWLRGVVIPRPRNLDAEGLRVQRRNGRMTVNELAQPLLDAIALEKAGFKGMRFLVHPRLLTRAVRNAAAIDSPAGREAPSLVRLQGASLYAPRLKGFEDLLWMATADEEEWRSRSARMTTRLRQSAHNIDEVVHAAATQVLFDRCRDELGFSRRRR